MKDSFFPGLDCTLLVGSGITDWGNLSLPSGQKVVKELVRFLLHDGSYVGDKRHKKIFDLEEFLSDTPFEILLNGYPDHSRLRSIFSKHYNAAGCNNIHSAIVDQVKNGVVSFVISANYDNCLEYAFDQAGIKFNCIIDESDLQNMDENIPTLFKIHGCVSKYESLVITLNQENRLPDWKLKLLKTEIKARNLCILGFSGNDFDICPAIFSPKSKPSHINWLHRRPKDRVSYNARRAQKEGDAFLFKGGFNDVFHSIGCNEKDSLNKSPLIEEIVQNLTIDEIHRWKFDLYNNLALGKFMYDLCDEYGIKYSPNVKNIEILKKKINQYTDG